jgi:hypothetical protein
MRASRRAATFFPLAASYRFCRDQGPGRGVGGARRGLRHEGAVQAGVREGKGTKGSERVVGKAAGDECFFIPGEGPDWQMRSGPTP